jgi:hypothetical protein
LSLFVEVVLSEHYIGFCLFANLWVAIIIP